MITAAAVARCSSLVLSALTTGVFFGTKVSLGPSTRRFAPATYVEVQQATVRNLRPVMGVLLPASAATNAVALALTPADRRSGVRALTWAGLATQVVALALTAAVELPINGQVLSWSGEAPPSGWEAVRDRWDRVHALRTASSIAGLVCLAAAATGEIPST